MAIPYSKDWSGLFSDESMPAFHDEEPTAHLLSQVEIKDRVV